MPFSKADGKTDDRPTGREHLKKKGVKRFTDITLGSLFDGIGVFPLAASRHGIRPVFASEIEKAPVSITRRHFPDMEQLGDVTKLDGGKIPPVHVLTFGSPCQNLSVEGRREGLAGAKSGLFFQAIRIIREMREARDNKFPVIAVWENVLGALFSNHGLDFTTVLESFCDTEIPMPATGTWARAGMVRGGIPDVAWRVLDAQYWGRPRIQQRRRLLFTVADFGGQRAAEILYQPRHMYPYFEAGSKAGLSPTTGNRIPSVEAGRVLPNVHPFQCHTMRMAAREGDKDRFFRCFGRTDDPFPTLLAKDKARFALWYGHDYRNGVIRYATPTEEERLMGLPDGWTALGAGSVTISENARYRALGNAIVLPCAEYIMAGIAAVLGAESSKQGEPGVAPGLERGTEDMNRP